VGFPENAVAILAILNRDDFRVEQLVQEEIRGRLFGAFAGQDERAIKAVTRRGSRGLPAVIGLDRPRRDHHPRSLAARFRDKEFQFAGFIAAKGQPGLVIAFDEEARPAKDFGQPGHFFNGSWQVGKMKAGDLIHGFLLENLAA